MQAKLLPNVKKDEFGKIGESYFMGLKQKSAEPLDASGFFT